MCVFVNVLLRFSRRPLDRIPIILSVYAAKVAKQLKSQEKGSQRFLEYHKSELTYLDLDVDSMQRLLRLANDQLHSHFAEIMKLSQGSHVGGFIFDSQLAMVSDARLAALIQDKILAIQGADVTGGFLLELKKSFLDDAAKFFIQKTNKRKIDNIYRGIKSKSMKVEPLSYGHALSCTRAATSQCIVLQLLWCILLVTTMFAQVLQLCLLFRRLSCLLWDALVDDALRSVATLALSSTPGSTAT